MNLILEYAKTGKAVSDFEVEEIFQELIKYTPCRCNTRVTLSTANIFDRFRLAVVSGEISPKDVAFKFEGRVININKYGRLSEWPMGFCDWELRTSEKILRLAMQMRREERNANS